MTNFLQWGLTFVSVWNLFGVKQSGSLNIEATPVFFENVYTPGMEYYCLQGRTYYYFEEISCLYLHVRRVYSLKRLFEDG
jgi:hypothetical protein